MYFIANKMSIISNIQYIIYINSCIKNKDQELLWTLMCITLNHNCYNWVRFCCCFRRLLFKNVL